MYTNLSLSTEMTTFESNIYSNTAADAAQRGEKLFRLPFLTFRLTFREVTPPHGYYEKVGVLAFFRICPPHHTHTGLLGLLRHRDTCRYYQSDAAPALQHTTHRNTAAEDAAQRVYIGEVTPLHGYEKVVIIM
jgi:hypothetical protein